MMYAYVTLPDETLVTHSDILDMNGVKSVKVHFERPTDKGLGFDMATCYLPSGQWIEQVGYNVQEMRAFDSFVKNNAHLLFRYAECGGVNIA